MASKNTQKTPKYEPVARSFWDALRHYFSWTMDNTSDKSPSSLRWFKDLLGITHSCTAEEVVQQLFHSNKPPTRIAHALRLMGNGEAADRVLEMASRNLATDLDQREVSAIFGIVFAELRVMDAIALHELIGEDAQTAYISPLTPYKAATVLSTTRTPEEVVALFDACGMHTTAQRIKRAWRTHVELHIFWHAAIPILSDLPEGAAAVIAERHDIKCDGGATVKDICIRFSDANLPVSALVSELHHDNYRDAACKIWGMFQRSLSFQGDKLHKAENPRFRDGEGLVCDDVIEPSLDK